MTPANPDTPLALGRADLSSFDDGARREWLSANGSGSFASGTVGGANTRRYHGLLVAALRPPLGRMTMLSKIDESVQVGNKRWDLSTNRYPDGVVYPDGWRYVESFTPWPVPTWTFQLGDGTALTKRVYLARNKNTVYITYTLDALARKTGPATLTLTPLVAWKDYHALMHPWPDFPFQQGALSRPGEGWFVQATPDAPALRLLARGAVWQTAGWWHEHVTLPREQERGFPFEEDLFCPALATFTLSRAGQSVAFIATAEEGNAAPDDPAAALAEIVRHQEGLAEAAEQIGQSATGRELVLAADQFVVRGAPNIRTTLLAGYPWFTDWGRDTMIALPGLCLTTGRFDVAREILDAFAGHVSEGMIPNRFPDQGETPDYNTVDATLWFVHACDRYVNATGDEDFRARLLPVLHAVLAAHAWGTRFGIHVDQADGLLFAGAPGVQLTWMDAKIGDWVVTPRAGKPVEINALFLNALRVLADWSQKANDLGGWAAYDALAERAQAAFVARFVRPDGRGLYDLIRPDDSPDEAIRPNQIIAAALPYSPLSAEQTHSVIETVRTELLTPFGLRTLSPHDGAYRPRYEGGPAERDAAYHQGTVWPWLLGPFADALLRVHGPGEETHQALQSLCAPLLAARADYGVGGVAEVFDAEPPQRPNGCPWQAWSVAALLRIWAEASLG